MAGQYSVQLCRELAEKFQSFDLYRPMRTQRYDPGDELTYQVAAIDSANKGSIRLIVDKFVGGGFAGQVYKVKLTDIETSNGPISALKVGQTYAIKILVPPSNFARLFRNFIYWVGFQGPFQLQVNPAAARSGALWQKFIRRAAGAKFGDERAVVDIYGTFIDDKLGSCGEISEWIDGRTWRFEVNDRMDLLKRWCRSRSVDTQLLGSPEYRAKREFMSDFVKLMHEMGVPEFARQYEWYTCKSQPNCLKRLDTEDDPSTGLTAVDFRPGLALLPFLPMSPGDFVLILKGLARGSLVQFDRGNVEKLQQFINTHTSQFDNMTDCLEELKKTERIYRDSLPDVTGNHIRLLYSGRLWSTIIDSAVTGWRVRNITDDDTAGKLRKNKLATIVFWLIGLVPVLGAFVRRVWGRADYRRHYTAMVSGWDYICRAMRGKVCEKVIVWHRAGRIDENRASQLANRPLGFFLHLPLSILPVGLYRFLTDWQFTKQVLAFICIRPLKLYFNAETREQWLRDMVAQGQKNQMLSDEDAEVIFSQVKDPFIQKYLKSLAVHICTLPVTQIVSVAIAAIYYFTHPDDPNAWKIGLGIIGLFQVTPISPGSICRGLYVVYLVIRERNFKDYNIAVFLGFFKYIGYLAFPIQMAYRYPVLARFMAGHWATGAVHIVPVFGEKGALLEHYIFDLFYNWPLTIRRRMRLRAEKRELMEPRAWHVLPTILTAAALFGFADIIFRRTTGDLPGLNDIWFFAGLIPFVAGAVITLGAGGMVFFRRIINSAVAWLVVGALYTVIHILLSAPCVTVGQTAGLLIWRLFICAIFSAVGAIIIELKLPEPKPVAD